MKEFLKKIKLIDNLQVELNIQKNVFIDKFRMHVDEGSTNILFGSMDIFSSGSNEYKGSVDYGGFSIRKKKKLFDTTGSMALASGTYEQKGEKLIIDTEINGFGKYMIVIFVILVLFYGVFITAITATGAAGGENSFILPFILVHGAFMIGIPYFIMRRGVKIMKRELEREFFFMTKA